MSRLDVGPQTGPPKAPAGVGLSIDAEKNAALSQQQPQGNVPAAVSAAQQSGGVKQVTQTGGMPQMFPQTPSGNGVFIPGLGNLDELAKEVKPQDETPGEGPRLVVLHHQITGTDGIYKRGRVFDASKLSHNWGKDNNLAAKDLKRYFDLGAVRIASPTEQGEFQIEIVDFPTTDVINEQAARIAAEQQVAELQAQVRELLAQKELKPEDIAPDNEKVGGSERGESGQGQGEGQKEGEVIDPPF